MRLRLLRRIRPHCHLCFNGDGEREEGEITRYTYGLPRLEQWYVRLAPSTDAQRHCSHCPPLPDQQIELKPENLHTKLVSTRLNLEMKCLNNGSDN